MNTDEKKSYVRVKVFLALVVSIFAYLYAIYAYWEASYKIDQMSLMGIGAFVLGMAASFYANKVKCERCKMEWHKAGNETYGHAKTILDFVRKFTAERIRWPHKKCKNCGLDRY